MPICVSADPQTVGSDTMHPVARSVYFTPAVSEEPDTYKSRRTLLLGSSVRFAAEGRAAPASDQLAT